LAKIFLPLALGAFFIFLTFEITTDQERQKIIGYMSQTPIWVIVLSLLFGLLSHLSRSIRWNYMLAPMGYKPRIINNLLSIMVAYLGNLGVPRSGEILRASTIATYERVPFAKAIGNIIAERIIDLLMLIIFIAVALVLNFQVIGQLLVEKSSVNWIRIFLIVVIVALVVFYPLRFLFNRVTEKKKVFIQKFGREFVAGIKVLIQMPDKAIYLMHSVFIWVMYFMMFYIVKFAFDDASQLGIGALLPAFIVGALTIATTNGGLGIYPLAVGGYLTSFGMAQESGLAFGWIVWTTQTVLIVVFGGLAFVALPIVNRNNKHRKKSGE